MNIFVNIDVLALLAILPFGQKLTDFTLTKRSSNPGSSIHYIRSRSIFPVVLFHWAFYSGFSYRAAYHSYVIVIPSMLSLCIFYGSDILLIKRWSYCPSRHPARVIHYVHPDDQSQPTSLHVCCRVLYSTLSSMCGVY